MSRLMRLMGLVITNSTSIAALNLISSNIFVLKTLNFPFLSFVGSGSSVYQVFDPRPLSYLEHCHYLKLVILI